MSTMDSMDSMGSMGLESKVNSPKIVSWFDKLTGRENKIFMYTIGQITSLVKKDKINNFYDLIFYLQKIKESDPISSDLKERLKRIFELEKGNIVRYIEGDSLSKKSKDNPTQDQIKDKDKGYTEKKKESSNITLPTTKKEYSPSLTEGKPYELLENPEIYIPNGHLHMRIIDNNGIDRVVSYRMFRPDF
ncbi:MAG: hypothetical protein Q7S74_06745 [Nanoarchaeota archaeon]|nr:hypothetical protein [Nanoarchaeota archaeon]